MAELTVVNRALSAIPYLLLMGVLGVLFWNPLAGLILNVVVLPVLFVFYVLSPSHRRSSALAATLATDILVYSTLLYSGVPLPLLATLLVGAVLVGYVQFFVEWPEKLSDEQDSYPKINYYRVS